MRLQTTRAAATFVALALAISGCNSDSRSAPTRPSDRTATADSSIDSAGTDTTANSGAFVAAPGRVPGDASEITGATDVRTMLTSLGFPSDWLVPKDVTVADVVGVAVRQTTGDDTTTYYYEFAFSRPAAPLDDVAAQWYKAYAEALGSEPVFATGTKKGNDVKGRLYSGGLPEDPAGELSVTAVGVDGGADPVVVEVELTIVGQGATTTLELSPTMLASVPDITGCVPFLVSADLALYASPNASTTDLGYRTIYDGTCKDTATFEAAVAWAVGRDGIVTQDAKHVEVTDTTGPNGTLLHVGAGTDSSIRIDTEQQAT